MWPHIPVTYFRQCPPLGIYTSTLCDQKNKPFYINIVLFYLSFISQEVLIDAPALVDLGHGTVRYRKPGEDEHKHFVTNKEGLQSGKTKTGYFYHTRLDDYSEGMT